MTSKEKVYFKWVIAENKRIIEEVENGELWDDIYTTKELKIAFIQGMHMGNDVFDKFING